MTHYDLCSSSDAEIGTVKYHCMHYNRKDKIHDLISTFLHTDQIIHSSDRSGPETVTVKLIQSVRQRANDTTTRKFCIKQYVNLNAS